MRLKVMDTGKTSSNFKTKNSKQIQIKSSTPLSLPKRWGGGEFLYSSLLRFAFNPPVGKAGLTA